jgi:predicted AAA+ superfamily ATPase
MSSLPKDPTSDAWLARICEALERLAPPSPPAPDIAAADAFVWHADRGALQPVPKVNRVDISLLRGVDRVRDALLENTTRFAEGLPANNVLLWGARGMGKSSLVKAAHASTSKTKPLKLIEIHREDIESWKAASRDGRRMSCSTRPRTAAICCRAK